MIRSLPFLLQNAVSVYIRLGFAHKKGVEMDDSKLHHSWIEKVNSLTSKRLLLYSHYFTMTDPHCVGSENIHTSPLPQKGLEIPGGWGGGDRKG